MPKKKAISPPFKEMKNSFIKHYQNMFIIRAFLDNIEHDLRFLATYDLIETKFLCTPMSELRVMQRSLAFLKVSIGNIKDEEMKIYNGSLKEISKKEVR